MKLSQTMLFGGITDGEIEKMQKSGCMRRQQFEKNDVIFHMGDIIREAGIILSGSVNIENIDLWGNTSIVGHSSQGQVFAEVYAICHKPMMVEAVAAEKSDILFLNYEMLMSSQELGDGQSKIRQNMLNICMNKNLSLLDRISCTTSKTIRGRLFTYLTGQSIKAGSTSFQIPFDRQQLADYLNLDRSALSKELGKMKAEGLLDYNKNHFTLYIDPEWNEI